MLSLKQLQDVCLSLQGSNECRYLASDGTTNNYVCLKKVAAKKDAIDKQVDKFIDKARRNGQDPYAMNRPLGNNCKGYPALTTKKQGYDVP